MISSSGTHRRFARAGRILRSWSNHADCQVVADQAMADKASDSITEGASQFQDMQSDVSLDHTVRGSNKRKADCLEDAEEQVTSKQPRTVHNRRLPAPLQLARRSWSNLSQAVTSASTQLLQPLLAFAASPHMAILQWRTIDTGTSVTPLSDPGPCTSSMPMPAARRASAPSLVQEMLESPVTVSKPVRPGNGSLFRTKSCLGMHDLAADTAQALARAAVLSPGHDRGLVTSLADSHFDEADDVMIADTSGHQEGVIITAARPAECKADVESLVEADSAAFKGPNYQQADWQPADQQSAVCSPTDVVSLSAKIGADCCGTHGAVSQPAAAVLQCTAATGLQQSSGSKDLQQLELPAVCSTDGSREPNRPAAFVSLGASPSQDCVASPYPGTASQKQIRRVSFCLPEGVGCDPEGVATPRRMGLGSPRRLSASRSRCSRYSPSRSSSRHGSSLRLAHAWLLPEKQSGQSTPPRMRHTHMQTVHGQSLGQGTVLTPSPLGCTPQQSSQIGKKGAESVRPTRAGHPQEARQAGVERALHVGQLGSSGSHRMGQPASERTDYLDIPRRVSCEKAENMHRSRHFVEVCRIDVLQQDCREAFLNEKLARKWRGGEAWAQLDLAGLAFTPDNGTSRHYLDAWKASAERYISKRGYTAAEKLRGSLHMEWQQLKAIRMRCWGAHQVAGMGQEGLHPHTPKSIMKRSTSLGHLQAHP